MYMLYKTRAVMKTSPMHRLSRIVTFAVLHTGARRKMLILAMFAMVMLITQTVVMHVAFGQFGAFSKQSPSQSSGKSTGNKKDAAKATTPAGEANGQAPAQSATANVKVPKADWITSIDVNPNKPAREFVYFRKKIQFSVLEQAQIQITASDSYELFLNGRRVGFGCQTESFDTIDITNYCKPGDNLIAVRAQNHVGDSGV